MGGRKRLGLARGEIDASGPDGVEEDRQCSDREKGEMNSQDRGGRNKRHTVR